ncbi:serine phosphatase [Actinobacteria bacterium OV320]|nr:serine phosphatase [Actinobacteria bacterium OV320]
MSGKGKRPGRPWGPPRGSCAEINQLVELVRSWLDESSVPVTQFHRKLTPDHFIGKRVPELRQLRDLLAGEALELDLVEAVADVCFEHEPAGRTAQRLNEARALWQRAQSSPTPLEGAQELALAQELLAAKNNIIVVYEEMQNVRTAYEASEHGRHQALQIATLLFAMLGQVKATVVELKRQVDALQPLSAEGSETHRGLELRLSRAQRQQTELSAQLSRAERERDTAQAVADHAARRIRGLEGELDELRLRMGHPDPALPEDLAAPRMPQPDRRAIGHDATLDDVDRALEKARAVLDEEHEAVQQAADDLGYRTPSDSPPTDADMPGARIVPVQVQRSSEPQPSARAEQSAIIARLSRTTRNNWLQFRNLIGLPWLHDGRMRFDLRERIRVQSKLPKLPSGWHREMALRPAGGQSFGGDFVVATRTNNGRTLEVVLTDVSGRGTEAASRALLLSGAFGGLLGSLPPEGFLPAANRYLLRQDWDEGFATSIYLVLDLDSGDFELFSAGHPPGLQRSAGSGRWEEKTAQGTLLGLYDVAEFAPVKGSLRPGDVLMLFTDGLIDGDIDDGIGRLTGEADRYASDGFHGATWHLIEAVAADVNDDRALFLIRREGRTTPR